MADIASLALAVLPILMSAAAQYNNCIGPVSRYKNCPREAREYVQQLEIQRAIFRNECRNLFEEIMDHDTASNMLNSLNTELWRDESIDRKLRMHLGESLQACSGVVQMVEQRLSEISGERQRFQSIVEQEKQVSHTTLLMDQATTKTFISVNSKAKQNQGLEEWCT